MIQMLSASPAEILILKVELLKAITNRLPTDPRHLLIYFNPNAGSNSRKHLNVIIKFLSLTNFTHELIETTHRGHCKEHLATIDPHAYSAVVIVSGDGLMH